MGYKRPVKTFVIEFDDEEYAGLEVEVKSLPLGEFLRVSKMMQNDDKSDEHVEELLKVFAGALVRWNLTEEDDTAVPCDYSGVLTLDIDFAMAVIGGWVNGMADVSKSLGKDSNSTVTSQAPPIPMDLAG
jgi:hypothetical protein